MFFNDKTKDISPQAGETKTLVGSTDSSIQHVKDDQFEIKQYVNGLASFIKSCTTPMTISIQGDWGSGKTSMMNMVKETLGDCIVPVWFNTWEYSQFNMGNDLSISLLSRLLKALQVKEQEKSDRLNNTLKTTYKVIKKASLIAVDHFAGGKAAEELEKMADKFAKGEDDAADAINNLKNEFQYLVDAKVKESGKDRIVVFIDDLDRLNPAKAVELLEILKVFLDCKNCVFVLAIDYAVVSQGVKEKYGDLIGEDKGKSFFDKIIQVPFKMPVAHYKVDTFVTKMFKQIGIDLSADESATDYVELIQTSVGCNPRTMKRLFNAYLLLSYISENVELSAFPEDEANRKWCQKMLFAVLCCQHAYEELYNFMIANNEDFGDSDLLKRMRKKECYRTQSAPDSIETEDSDGNDDSGNKLAEAFKNVSDDRISRIVAFMKCLVSIIDRDGDKTISTEESEAFKMLLNLTTITAAGNDSAVEVVTDEKRHRKLTRQIMSIANAAISEKIMSMDEGNQTHPVYQSNSMENSVYYPGGHYMPYWADSWSYITVSGKGKIGFEALLMSDTDTGKASLMCFWKRCKDFPKAEFEKYYAVHTLVKDHGFQWTTDKKRIYKIFDNIGEMTENSERQKDIAERIAKIVIDVLDKM